MSNRTALLTLLLTLGFDQLSKDVSHLFGFTTRLNAGVSFSFFSSFSAEILTLLLLVCICLFWYKLQHIWVKNQLAAGLFFGGGISNVLDRALYGGVRDWLSVPLTTLSNNLADWAIGIALVLLLRKTLQTTKQES